MTVPPRGSPQSGAAYAFACLALLGVMPIIVNGRPAGASPLSFALLYSLWQLALSLPLTVLEWWGGERGVFREAMPAAKARRVGLVTLGTGALFALAAWAYVAAFEAVGSVNAAVALQVYPLVAAALEMAFLGRRKRWSELLATGAIVAALYYLASGGTGRLAGLGPAFAVALAVPLLWAVAHVTLRQILTTTPITPNQVTTSRLAVSVLVLTGIALGVDGPGAVATAFADPGIEGFAALMGLAYYVELILWFHAMRHIDVSLASTITVPAPALTLVLAVALLGEPVATYQVVALVVVAAGLWGVIAVNRPRPARR